MNLIHTTALSPTQKSELRELAAACKAAEPLSLSVPVEDGLDYFLLYQNHRLAAMLFLFFPEETLCECGAFTQPSMRRQGYFSTLLEAATAHVEALEDSRSLAIDLCFLLDSGTPSALETIRAIGAEYWYSEYKMERALSSSDAAFQTELVIQEAEPGIYTASKPDGTLVGTCVLLPSGSDVYFYGFEIRETLRGQGLGRTFLQSMLSLLSDKGFQSISLQVSGQNQPALALYKKTGFRITETLDFYLY